MKDTRRGPRFRPTARSDRQRGLGAHAAADAAVFLAGNRLVELQRIAPEGLRAERVEAKDAPAFLDHALRVRGDLAVVFREGFPRCQRLGVSPHVSAQSEPDENRQRKEDVRSHRNPFGKARLSAGGLLRSVR